MQLTTDIVMLWSLVRNGITDSDLAALLHDEWNALDFSCIKGWMSDLLCEEWDTQRIALAYDFGYDSSQNRRERAQQLTGELLKYLVGKEDTDNPLLLDNLLHCTLMSGYLDLLPHILPSRTVCYTASLCSIYSMTSCDSMKATWTSCSVKLKRNHTKNNCSEY